MESRLPRGLCSFHDDHVSCNSAPDHCRGFQTELESKDLCISQSEVQTRARSTKQPNDGILYFGSCKWQERDKLSETKYAVT